MKSQIWRRACGARSEISFYIYLNIFSENPSIYKINGTHQPQKKIGVSLPLTPNHEFCENALIFAAVCSEFEETFRNLQAPSRFAMLACHGAANLRRPGDAVRTPSGRLHVCMHMSIMYIHKYKVYTYVYICTHVITLHTYVHICTHMYTYVHICTQMYT